MGDPGVRQEDMPRQGTWLEDDPDDRAFRYNRGGGDQPPIEIVLPDDKEEWVTGDWWTDFEKLFPGWAELAKGNSEIRGIFEEYFTKVDDGLAYTEHQERILGLIKNSKWYRTQTASIRDSILLEIQDPATYKQNVYINKKDAKQIAYNSGLSFTETEFNDFAERAERYDWNLSEFQEWIVQRGRSQSEQPVRGSIKRTHDDIQSYAQSMLVPIGGKAWDFAYKIDAGNDSMENAKDHIQGLAETTFDFVDIQSLASRGLTVSDLLANAKETIAGTLELNPTDVHLYEMSMDDLVVGEGDSKRFINGQEAETWAKKQGRYQMTDDFRGGIRDIATSIATTFGRR